MKILIVDDHAIVRRGAKQILQEELGCAEIAEAQDADEALHIVQSQDLDLVILDISLPGRSGLDLLSELRYCRPTLPILVMSMYSEEQYALRALKFGVAGYLNKQSAPEELVKAVRKIMAGGKYISNSMAEILAFNVVDQRQKPIQELLSDREYQILILIAAGNTVTEIADKLALSVKTVSTYRARLLKRMNLKNNAELTYFAVHNHLLE